VIDVAGDRLDAKLGYLDGAGLARVHDAYAVAERAHAGVLRKSGEPYITHPVAVAGLLADMHLDADALCAGLLHDTVEDTEVTFDDVEARFGVTVRRIVEGETKISKLAVRVYADEQSENLRQMLLSMVSDVRVILVKLADRLHNMRTLDAMPPHKQQRIAKETLEIFAPLAHRLGISHIKNELEDLAFRYLEPERYRQLARQVRMRTEEREAIVASAIATFEARLAEEGLAFEVSGRSKHLYSIHRKMHRDNKGLEQIFDLTAIRAVIDPMRSKTELVGEEAEKAVCYRALGIVHSLWTPIPGRFKDYVAVPKPNGYQSLHTTVVGSLGHPIEVQIRTRGMHEIAEYGVAAHWAYKQGIEDGEEVRKRLTWMQQLLEADADAVKFQTFHTENLVTKDASPALYQERSGNTNQYEMLSEIELSEDAFSELVDYCEKKDIEFLSTPYDCRSVDLLDELGVERFKVASADITNKPLLEHIASKKKQVILSSGMATMEEIAQAVSWLHESGVRDIVLLHCVSDYPSRLSDQNLRVIETLKNVFGVPVGFSDHTVGLTAPVTAVSLGAAVVEKHFTLDTKLEGPDHKASIELEELGKLVTIIRECERALGNPIKKVSHAERENAVKMRRSLHAATDLEAGERLTLDRVVIVRPADGLEPRHFESVLGSKVNREITGGEPLTWEDIA
jgi:sialic acid synthase SpsE